ncbi:hypothetical protein FF38_06401 [Lucilia cuprina]|uniref:Uncharacterized protein n=1 Tax=Lucilia cuprina TaxID=7375 RepID=A0A0L0BSU9_LUCCU|nr:hypothetical protein FF38_06401 [Lucilia cuprina]
MTCDIENKEEEKNANELLPNAIASLTAVWTERTLVSIRRSTIFIIPTTTPPTSTNNSIHIIPNAIIIMKDFDTNILRDYLRKCLCMRRLKYLKKKKAVVGRLLHTLWLENVTVKHFDIVFFNMISRARYLAMVTEITGTIPAKWLYLGRKDSGKLFLEIG